MENNDILFLCEDEKYSLPFETVVAAISESGVKSFLSSLFLRNEDSLLALLNENGTVVDLKKDWLGGGKKQFTAVYSEFAPSKKSKVTITEEKEFSKTDKLVRLFKNVHKVNTDLLANDDVVEVKPDLPLAEKKHQAFGQVNLQNCINLDQTFCLNESSEFTWQNVFLKGKQVYLESESDAQLLFNIRFSESVNLHSFLIKGHPKLEGSSPATIKLFFNQFHIDFDQAESMVPKQVFTLTEKHYKENKLLVLDPFKWQNTTSITFYVESNIGDADTSIIRSIKLFGKPSKRQNPY